MKTVAKIDPEKEYETAKKIIEIASESLLNKDDLSSLGSSVDNLISAARILLEREAKRRGHPAPPPKDKPNKDKSGKIRDNANKLPSVRFPDVEVDEKIVRPEVAPLCSCCNSSMKESGLFLVSEKLDVIPKKYIINRSKRVIFNCSVCHGAMTNTPAAPSILLTSNYGDSLIIDVALSKYCDLIPIERYTMMAYRSGLLGDLPAHSLIGLTHHFANFLIKVNLKIKEEVLAATVLHADETPHRMLEGDDTKNWYLWGFFSTTACYFETHNTRSGDIPLAFLKLSKAQTLMTDGYAGYGRAVRLIKADNKKTIAEAHCNAHAYRYFEDASITWKEECKVFLEIYAEIYKLEKERKENQPDWSDEKQLACRQQMLSLFEKLKKECEKARLNIMLKSSIDIAINYFINHFNGLTLCTGNIEIPLDNNLSERELRAYVIGRKTWIGTHSKRGAETSASMFSIVQSCKLNKINPRDYFPWIVARILKGEEILTPFEYKKLISAR